MTKQETELSSESSVKKPKKEKSQEGFSHVEKSMPPGIENKPRSKEPTLNKAQYAALFIITPIIVGIGSAILLLMHIWDWQTALGVPTLAIGALEYLKETLKPKPIAPEDVREQLQQYRTGIFLVLIGIFLAASLIAARSSQNDLNKQILESNRNYDSAVATLSFQQNVIQSQRTEIGNRDTQVSNLQLTQAAQSTLIAQQVAEISSLSGTLEVLVPPTPAPLFATESPISDKYILYDTFNKDSGSLKIIGNQAQCPITHESGVLKIECFGSATEGVNLTLFPAEANVLTSRGIEMAFYTLPQLQGTNQWGKYQIQSRFGATCEDFDRGYNISIRSNELTFVETDGKFNSINPPSPKMSIGTLEPHVVKIELENGQVNFYLDNTKIRSVIPLENTVPVCWMFQSEDNDNHMADGYRGISLMWIATKP